MIIKQNQSNTVVLTFQENVTLPSPHYLFVITNEFTKATTSFICADISPNKQRFNEFIITETAGTQNRLTGTIALRPNGWWSFKVYEQVSSTNLDYTLAAGQVDYGRFRVEGTVDTNFYV